MDTNNRIEILYLNEQDMINSDVKNMSACLNTIEDMFITLHEGDYRMEGEGANGHGAIVRFPKETNVKGMPTDAPDYRIGALPAYLGGRFHVSGVKTYGSHNTNKSKGLPRSILMMQLLDTVTGIPVAYMSANILSAMRTGAVVGLGAKYLANENPKVLAAIGPGAINSYAVKAVTEACKTIEKINVVGLDKKTSNNFIEKEMANCPTLKEGICCESIEEACQDADIVVFCTPNATKFEDNPKIEKNWLKKDALVISISALQVPTEILSDENTVLITDNYDMYAEWGYGNELPTQRTVSTLLGMGIYDAVRSGAVNRSSIINIGEIIAEKKTVRTRDDQLIIFAVGGMPIEDIAWGYDCYIKAKEQNIGTSLLLWEESAL